MTPELGLLLACATVFPRREDEDAIRQMLAEGIDWTLFARKAIDHDLACLAGHTLAHVAPEMVPDDVLDALRIIVDQFAGETARYLMSLRGQSRHWRMKGSKQFRSKARSSPSRPMVILAFVRLEPWTSSSTIPAWLPP